MLSLEIEKRHLDFFEFLEDVSLVIQKASSVRELTVCLGDD